MTTPGPAPYRYSLRQLCRNCGSEPNAEHIGDCWVAETIRWAMGQTPINDRLDELTAWWVELAHNEAAKVVPKAVEYGATDLAEIGRQLEASGVDLSNRPGSVEAHWAELGVYFYVIGKLARWTDAVANGRAVSDDTLHDIGVYIRMAQRIRSHGGWPAVNLEAKQ